MKNVKAGHSKPIVCLDAGHYGKYNQSPVVKSYYESNMTWKLHLKLKAELEKKGIIVTTTRKSQNFDLDLVLRGEASKGADLFLSLHSNAASNSKPNWVVGMYFVDDNCGKIDEQSHEIANLLSQEVAQVMGVTYQISTRKSSKDRDGNGYKDDYYGVLRGAHSVGTPGIILEHGFHTNKANTEWLMKDGNLDKLAKAEAEVIAKWFDVTTTQEVKYLDFKLPVLKRGMKGDAVTAFQKQLKGLGYNLGSTGPEKDGVDGSFGGKTEDATKKYQSDNNLTPDGVCGRNTWNKRLGL